MNELCATHPLTFVVAVSDWEIFCSNLAKSESLCSGRHRVHLQWHASSAAEVLNRHLLDTAYSSWVVWVHQDVFLPLNWDVEFITAIAEAEANFGRLAVIGPYGVKGRKGDARRVGRVLDRGVFLDEAEPMPSLVDSLDELLFAVRPGIGLQLDANLKFDFYATDLVLQAQQKGYQAAVVDAYCEHWSRTPQKAPFSADLIDRVADSGRQFEAKWSHLLPIDTPIVHIGEVGDVDRFANSLKSHSV